MSKKNLQVLSIAVIILQNFHVLLKLFGLAIIKQKNYKSVPFQFTILNNFISCLNGAYS